MMMARPVSDRARSGPGLRPHQLDLSAAAADASLSDGAACCRIRRRAVEAQRLDAVPPGRIGNFK